MLRFECDYTEGCIPEILEAIALHNHAQYPGYSEDACTERARARMKALCGREDIAVHFLVGGTQANTTVIAAALRHHQGVIAAATGHIACHETGAVEAAGHKVIALPSETGRLSAQQIENLCTAHWSDPSFEHQTQPAMVYLSHPAENGTIYSLSELREIRAVCDKWHLKLFLDGARLGYGLAAPDSDVTVQDLAQLTDVFYLGGTKVGALFGEAVVITDPELAVDFRYHIKQRGGMLAKGWLLGLQFDVLLENDRYMTISRKAVAQAMRLRRRSPTRAFPSGATRIPTSSSLSFRTRRFWSWRKHTSSTTRRRWTKRTLPFASAPAGPPPTSRWTRWWQISSGCWHSAISHRPAPRKRRNNDPPPRSGGGDCQKSLAEAVRDRAAGGCVRGAKSPPRVQSTGF